MDELTPHPITIATANRLPGALTEAGLSDDQVAEQLWLLAVKLIGVSHPTLKISETGTVMGDGTPLTITVTMHKPN